jgi:aspartate carbamoyltransferase catalytic subunit
VSNEVDLPRHLLSVRDLSRENIRGLLTAASQLSRMPAADAGQLLVGKVLAVLFFQPSTRTRIGFEVSAMRLGARITGFSDPSTTRAVEYTAETLADTVRVVGEFTDAIVMRHFVAGSARQAAAVAGVPVINGGDGSNEHPTQALNDVWLMERKLGGLEGAVIGIVGDPGTRVMRSLMLALAKLGVGKILLLVPPRLPLRVLVEGGLVHTTFPEDLRLALDRSGVRFEFRSDVRELLDEADAIEMMPVAIPTLEAVSNSIETNSYVTPERFRITKEKISATRSGAIILHPGPRADELHADTDDLSNSLYFEQARESLFMRMAVLAGFLRSSALPERSLQDIS